jgi:hypothetical protein
MNLMMHEISRGKFTHLPIQYFGGELYFEMDYILQSINDKSR